MDVAHNEQGLLAVLKELKYSNVTVICGFGKNKDVQPLLQLFLNEQKVKAIHTVSCEHFRLTKAPELNKLMRSRKT